MDAALEQRVERLLFLGSSCIYPRLAPQPITRGLAPDRAPRADQRRVRDRQDRRDPRRPGRSAGVRPAVDLRDADQPLRAGRQLLGLGQSPATGPDPAVRRGRGRGGAVRHELGHRDTPPRAPARRRHGRRLSAPDGALRRREPGQRRHRSATPRSARSRKPSPMWSATRARRGGTLQAGRHPPQAARRRPLHALGWSARTSLADGIAATVAWYRDHAGSCARSATCPEASLGPCSPWPHAADRPAHGQSRVCAGQRTGWNLSRGSGSAPELIIPAPTVTPVASSIRMNEPVVRFFE